MENDEIFLEKQVWAEIRNFGRAILFGGKMAILLLIAAISMLFSMMCSVVMWVGEKGAFFFNECLRYVGKLMVTAADELKFEDEWKES